jgi:hypothetical protein
MGFLMTGCTSVQNQTTATKISLTDDSMVGFLLSMDVQKRELVLNISDWVNRDKSGVDDVMHSKIITYNQHTVFQDEHGAVVTPEDFRIGEK